MSKSKRIFVFSVFILWSLLSVFTLFQHVEKNQELSTLDMCKFISLEGGMATFSLIEQTDFNPLVNFKYPNGEMGLTINEAIGNLGLRGCYPLGNNRLGLSLLMPCRLDTLVVITSSSIHITEYVLAVDTSKNRIAFFTSDNNDRVELVISNLDGISSRRVTLDGVNKEFLQSPNIQTAFFNENYFQLEMVVAGKSKILVYSV